MPQTRKSAKITGYAGFPVRDLPTAPSKALVWNPCPLSLPELLTAVFQVLMAPLDRTFLGLALLSVSCSAHARRLSGTGAGPVI